MKLRLHTCAAEGCQHVISARMLMCIDHWRMVPAPLRREIVHQLKRRRSAADPADRVDAAANYGNAVRQAVATVREKQERKVQAAAGPSGSLFNT